MKVKIQIKSILEQEKEQNTITKTLIKAIESGAYLRGTDLSDAGGEKTKVKTFAVFTGLYKYVCLPFITTKNEQLVTMGCFTRTRREWEKDFWNNDDEFPNDGSMSSELRKLAFETACKWLDLNAKGQR